MFLLSLMINTFVLDQSVVYRCGDNMSGILLSPSSTLTQLKQQVLWCEVKLDFYSHSPLLYVTGNMTVWGYDEELLEPVAVPIMMQE